MRLKFSIYSALILLALSCAKENGGPESMQEHSEDSLFSHPLILGASVSAGHGTSDGGPAAVIARMQDPNANIKNLAKGGATSIESTKDLDLFSLEPSIVLGLDLFFWDAANHQCGSGFKQQARTIMDSFAQRGIPMVIGKVPTGVDFPRGVKEVGQRPCSARINAFLKQHCTLAKNCLLYDPRDCLEAMDSPISPAGEPYFSDDLHTSEAGNEFCAQEFINAGEFAQLKTKP